MEQNFLNPEQVLSQIDLFPEMIAADFGCGSGGWAIPLAKRLKESKIFAIDILKEPLSALKGKADLEKVFNIQTICSDVEKEKGSKLQDNSINLVLLTNILFQSEKKENVLIEAKRVLKKDGIILVIDWMPGAFIGPDKKLRISIEEAKKLAEKISLKIKQELKPGFHHWGLILEK